MGEIVLDSLAPVLLGILEPEKPCRIVDVGCGSGIPILPLAVTLKRAAFTGVDSSSKRLDYAAALARNLHLENVEWRQMHVRPPKRILSKRIIDGDFVVARGLAKLDLAIPMCDLFRKPGGTILISTTENSAREYTTRLERSYELKPYARPDSETPYAILMVRD